MMWLLIWWPYALLHRLNPFLTHVVWPPKGVNLAWMTSIPGPSLLAFPLTYSFGPIVSYNLISLLAPALSAWSAYLLCADITRRFWPSLAGGLLYGFSSYEVGQVLGGHLSLNLVMLPPLIVLLFLRLVEGRIATRRFILWFTVLLILQFLVSNEIFATMTLFGVAALILAWSLGGRGLRVCLQSAIPNLIICYLLATVVLSPYLYYIFAFGMPRNPIYSPDYYSADLMGFILPNKLSYFYFPALGLDSDRFLFDPWENGAYLGLPLLLLCAWYCVENWATLTGKVLAISLGLILLAALGPLLHIAGHHSAALPWAIALRLPLLKHALPGRFMLFAFLDFAVMASIWLSRTERPGAGRMILLLLCLLFLWPSEKTSILTNPPFFTQGTYRYFLPRNSTVLIVPFGDRGQSMLWQAESLMYFNMAGGWLGPTPMEFEHWPIVQGLHSSILMPDSDAQLRAFLGHYGIGTVLLENSTKGPWREVFSKLDSSPASIGEVGIYKVGAAALGEFRGAEALRAEGRSNLARFDEMLVAASQYLQRGLDPSKLNCARAQELGLMPDRGESLAATNQSGWCYSMWFGQMGSASIGIGLIGYYAGLKPVIARYGLYANDIFYPYPDKLTQESDPDRLGALMITFSRDKLALAAAAASKETARDSLTGRIGEADAAGQIPQPDSSARVTGHGVAPSSLAMPAVRPDDFPDGLRPVITAVNGRAVSNRGKGIVAAVLPARRAIWGPWWREVEADDLMVIDGHGFDTQNGVAVDLYCACPGGEVGPFFLEPDYHPYSGTQILLKVPVYGANAPLAGPGSIVVSNKGRDGRFGAKSNRVPVWIGPKGVNAQD
ncbi:MAG: hypothetical protein ACLQU2_32240 [Candidatus Binataceae bacterium]